MLKISRTVSGWAACTVLVIARSAAARRRACRKALRPRPRQWRRSRRPWQPSALITRSGRPRIPAWQRNRPAEPTVVGSRLGGRRGLLPDFPGAVRQRRSVERSDARVARIAGHGAARRGRFRPGPATGMPAPIGKRSSARTFSRTASSTGATAAILQGVIDKLDYLSNLGINTIYFNPVFYARSLHKYDGNSFHHIDPYFGPDPAGDLTLMAEETSDPTTWHWTAADKLFLELLRQAHARGIRVIIDGVFNHTGRDFFAFADLARAAGRVAVPRLVHRAVVRRSGHAAERVSLPGLVGRRHAAGVRQQRRGQRSARRAQAVHLRHHDALDGPQRRRRPARRHRRLAARRGQRGADRLLARLARTVRGDQSGVLHGGRNLGRCAAISRRRRLLGHDELLRLCVPGERVS